MSNRFEINFDGNLLADVIIENEQIKVLRAVNGYGEKIDINKIQITQNND